jgi:hypothetical protein
LWGIEATMLVSDPPEHFPLRDLGKMVPRSRLTQVTACKQACEKGTGVTRENPEKRAGPTFNSGSRFITISAVERCLV